MMGSPGAKEEGIIPRLCNALFERIKNKSDAESATWSAKVKTH